MVSAITQTLMTMATVWRRRKRRHGGGDGGGEDRGGGGDGGARQHDWEDEEDEEDERDGGGRATATALACTRREIPPFHYMVAVAGGATIPCAAYATFGTEALAQAVVAALAGRSACLLANHGLVAIGPSLARARRLAVEVEELARQYLLALDAGGPVLLNDAEIADAIRQFKGYGQQDT